MSTNKNSAGDNSSTSRLVDSVDQMVRWPFQMTGATWDLMMQGMQSMTGSRSDTPGWSANSGSTSERPSGSNGAPMAAGWNDQDLSGDDLKYVMWSIAFTKPGFECVLEPQHEEIVNYSADGASFAAVKIARFLEKARHGRAERPETWGENYPPAAAKTTGRRTAGEPPEAAGEKGWRIPAEDREVHHVPLPRGSPAAEAGSGSHAGRAGHDRTRWHHEDRVAAAPIRARLGWPRGAPAASACGPWRCTGSSLSRSSRSSAGRSPSRSPSGR